MELNKTELPQSLESMDDYQKVALGFVLPFLHERAGLIADVIKDLHSAIDKGDLEQEQVDFYINRIKELTAFASSENPMNAYFRNVIKLERKLNDKGLFSVED